MLLTVLLGSLAVALATFLGSVVGFAYGLVALPLLLLLGYPLDQVVVANLLIALVTRVVVIWRRWRDADRGRSVRMLIGVLPGTLLGLLVVRQVSRHVLQLAAGVVVLLAVLGLVLRDWWLSRQPASPTVRGRGRTLELITGSLGGFLGATTSLNGVPSALLLTGRRVGARTMVADMAVYFVGGNLLTALVLIAGQRFPIGAIAVELAWWIPAGVIGSAIGLRLGPRLPELLFRRLALVLITLSGMSSVTGALTR